MTNSPLLKSSWEQSTTRRLLRASISWPTLRGLLLAGAVLLTLVALFYAVEDWRGNRAWEKQRRALEAKGEKLLLAELAPPPVPDAQNLAMAPILRPIYEFSRNPEGMSRWHDTNAMDRLHRIVADKRIPGQSVRALALGNLDKGILTDLEACRQFYLGNTNYPQAAADASPAQAIRVALGKFDTELQELRAAAAARPACRFPINYAEEPPCVMLLPHLSILKGMATVLELRAIANLDLGQTELAFADLELGFRLAASVRDEPLLIDHLVRLAMLSLNLQVVREGLARHAWNDAQLATIETNLAAIDILTEYKQAIRGECAMSTGTVEYVRRQGWNVDRRLIDGDYDASWLSTLAYRLMPGGWFQQNKAHIARLFQDYTLVAVDLQPRRVSPDISEAGEKAAEQVGSGPYSFFVGMLFPSVSRATAKSARMQTYVDAARLACALERYRLAQNRLPDSLNALQPRFIEKIPADLIDGQPLRYWASLEAKPQSIPSAGTKRMTAGREAGPTKRS